MNNRRSLLLVVFLILYGLINFLSQRQGNGVFSTVLLLLFWATVFVSLKAKCRLKEYGIALCRFKDKSAFLLIALVLIVIISNIAFMFRNNTSGLTYFSRESFIFDLIALLSCAFGEEVFFRGILLSFFRKKGVKTVINIIGVSALFSVSHIINLLSGFEISYVLIQLLFSFSVGLCLTAVSYYTNSIVITFVLHSLINITAVNDVSFNKEYIVISVALIIICSIIIYKREYRELKI